MLKVRLDGTGTRGGKIGRGIRQGRCLSPILINLYRQYLTNEALEGFGDFRIGGQVIRTLKYANKLALLAKEVVVLHGMFDRKLEIGRHYRMEINVQQTRLMRISRQPSPAQIMIGQTQLQKLRILKYLSGLLKKDTRCAGETKSRVAIQKAVFNEKKILFTSKLTLNLRKKLMKCYSWTVAVYGSEIWTLRKVDQKYLEVVKRGAEEGCERLVEPIIRQMKYYKTSTKKGISYKQ